MEYPKLIAIAGYAIEFYYKAGDEKLSFRVKGSEKLTEKLLKNCKTKRIDPLDISYGILHNRTEPPSTKEVRAVYHYRGSEFQRNLYNGENLHSLW